MDHRSFRDMLAFSIGFVIERNRTLLRRLLKEHVTDDARAALGKRWWSTSSCRDSRSTKTSRS